MTSPLGGLVPGFGSKRRTAPQIVPLLGPHDQYWEPFAFSCAVLLAKPQVKHEVVSEKNPDVVNLIRCLSAESTAVRLWQAASLAPVSETLFSEAAVRLARTFDDAVGEGVCVERAVDFLLVS